MRTSSGRRYGKTQLRKDVNSLSGPEVLQLHTLGRVHENPNITATWRKPECERLVELGFASRTPFYFATVYSITPRGLEALGLLDD